MTSVQAGPNRFQLTQFLAITPDIQLVVDPAVIEYAAPRLPRTFAAALTFVDHADREAARRKKKITVVLAKEILTGLEETAPEANGGTESG